MMEKQRAILCYPLLQEDGRGIKKVEVDKVA